MISFSTFLKLMFLVLEEVIKRIFNFISTFGNTLSSSGTEKFFFFACLPFFSIFGFLILRKVFSFLRGDY